MIKDMPIPESISVAYFVLSSVAAGVVAQLAATTPNAEDAWSVIGAMLAGGISMAHAVRAKRSMLDLGCVLVAAAVCGSILPGAIIYLQCPEVAPRLTWHAWAGMGFIGGLAGWSFTRGLIAFFEGINWGRWFRKKTGLDDDAPKNE